MCPPALVALDGVLGVHLPLCHPGSEDVHLPADGLDALAAQLHGDLAALLQREAHLQECEAVVLEWGDGAFLVVQGEAQVCCQQVVAAVEVSQLLQGGADGVAVIHVPAIGLHSPPVFEVVVDGAGSES